MKRSLFILMLLLTSGGLFAQETVAPCATLPGRSEWLQKYQENPQAYAKSGEMQYLPIVVHNVGTDLGFGYFKVEEVFAAFCTLNEDFLASNIQFYLAAPINYIANSDYYEHDYNTGADMMFENNVPGVINCYIVKDPAGACGYWWGWPDAIALRKGCLAPGDHTWAHEVGHFLSLPHTFDGWEGTDYNANEPTPAFVGGWAVEKVDGSNCFNAGDGFCDTPPDYLSYRWSCDENGMSNALQLDPDSIAFRSDGSLFMSYASDACSNRFSDEQIEAMRANSEFGRPELPITGNPLPPVTLTTEITGFNPVNDAIVPNNEPLTLIWDPVPGATQYVVQFSLTEEFIFVLHEYFTDEPSVIANELRTDRKYYWRVMPFNEFNTCHGYLPTNTFTTADVTAVQTIAGLEGLRISPNPAGAGQEIRVQYDLLEAQPLHLRIYHPTGALIRQEKIDGLTGNNRMVITTAGWPAGLYLLSLENGNGKNVNKLIIH